MMNSPLNLEPVSVAAVIVSALLLLFVTATFAVTATNPSSNAVLLESGCRINGGAPSP